VLAGLGLLLAAAAGTETLLNRLLRDTAEAAGPPGRWLLGSAGYVLGIGVNTVLAIDGLEKALAGLGLLEEALAMDLRRPQDYFRRLWTTNFRAADLAAVAQRSDPHTDPGVH
jgi:hypothetical protein